MKKPNKEISVFNTFVDASAKTDVGAVLESTFLSEGKLVKEFENLLNKNLGLKNPVAVNSGTSALHLALILAGIKEGDEVICPAQTFVATAIAIMQCGATPIFADIQYETGNIDPNSIEQKITKKTRAILPVHWGGYPCDMYEIRSLAKKHELMVVGDAAHALGATYKKKPIGSLSDFTCFSFQAIKHVTTGDGGAISCLKKSDAERAFVKRWFGIDRAHSKSSILGEREYDIKEIGYKYHLNDYAAALGIANLKSFGERLKKRQSIAKRYRKELENVSGVHLFEYQNDRESAYWLFGMHVEKREHFIRALKERGIIASVVHRGIDHNTLFGGTKKELINQRQFDETQIHIPLHDGLNNEEVSHIIASIKKGW